MDAKVAKELLHIREWLIRAQTIVDAGREAYDDDPLLQEAGDSLMVKLGEAANRLSRGGYAPPDGIDWSDAITDRAASPRSTRRGRLPPPRAPRARHGRCADG